MASKENALQFLFSADALMKVCKTGKGVQITSYLEDGTDSNGNAVSIMRVIAKSVPKPPPSKAAKKVFKAAGEETAPGCPIPPCTPQ